MTNTQRFPTVAFSKAGLLFVLGALFLGLTGCYTQLQVVEDTRRAQDRDRAYADEYRREYRRNDRRTTVKHTYTYYGDWYHDPFYHDPFYYDPWHRPYRSHLSFSLFYSSSPYYSWGAWHPSYWYYDPFRYHTYRPYYAGLYDDPYYYYGSSSPARERTYRPRGGSIGHGASTTQRRGTSVDRRGTAKSLTDKSSRGRIGRSAGERVGRSQTGIGRVRSQAGGARTENGRVGRRRSGQSKAGAPRRSTGGSSRGTRTGRRSGSDDGSKARGSSSSRTGRGRSGRRSSGSDAGSRSSRDEGSRFRQRGSFGTSILRRLPDRVDSDRYEAQERRLLERKRMYSRTFSGRRSDRSYRSRSSSSKDVRGLSWSSTDGWTTNTSRVDRTTTSVDRDGADSSSSSQRGRSTSRSESGGSDRSGRDGSRGN